MRTRNLLRTIPAFAILASLAVTISPAMASPATTIKLEQIAEAKCLGQRGAPIVIEDFADYQCPTCKVLFLETTRKLIQDYVAAGKVYLVHHDFPIVSLHPHSREAARWACAGALIGKFELVEEALYSRQEAWGATGDIEGALSSVLTASEMKRAKALVNAPEIDQSIQSDMQLGNQRRVGGTPTVFVTYKGKTAVLPPGAISYPLLKQYLDYLLKQ